MQATLTEFLAYLITLLHLWLMLMVLFRWKKGFARDLMDLSDEDAERMAPYARYFAIHCGAIGALTLWATITAYQPSIWVCQQWAGAEFRKCLYVAIVAIGVFGGAFVNRKLLLLQALPAAVGFMLT